jgi:hypothetical protein
LSDEFEVDVRGDDADSMQGVGGGDDASHHDQGRCARAEECRGDGESGDADAGHKISRMVNNDKGRAELKGFRALGFRLTYYRNDVERGIEMYESSALEGKDLGKYGLVESGCDLWRGAARVAGKKLLMMHAEALRHVFEDESISRYQDLWKENGAIDRRARAVDEAAREAAVGHFSESLQVRARQLAKHPGGADAGHQQMRDEMGKCIRRIEALVREDRQRRALKMEQVSLPCLARNRRASVRGVVHAVVIAQHACPLKSGICRAHAFCDDASADTMPVCRRGRGLRRRSKHLQRRRQIRSRL